MFTVVTLPAMFARPAMPIVSDVPGWWMSTNHVGVPDCVKLPVTAVACVRPTPPGDSVPALANSPPVPTSIDEPALNTPSAWLVSEFTPPPRFTEPVIVPWLSTVSLPAPPRTARPAVPPTVVRVP